MKIVLKSRRDAFLRQGGDTIEMIESKRYLEKRGHDVSISLSPDEVEKDVDLIHVFNLNRPGDSYLHARAGKESGKIIVLSAIYWNEDEFRKRAIYPSTPTRRIVQYLNLPEKTQGLLKNLRDRVRGIEISEGILFQRRIGFKETQKALLSLVDLVITGSQIEMDVLRSDFDYQGKGKVVPKGISPGFYTGIEGESPWDLKPGYVLSVGRIERHKNQLTSINALTTMNMDLVLAGEPNPADRDYYASCRSSSGDNVHFLGKVEHSRLPFLYNSARVHLQPSWFEIPGLATLEAAVSGCNVVVTNRGSASEYLGDMAWYVDPSDENGVREAVEEAFNSPPKTELKEYLMNTFRWERTAERLEEVYQQALDS